MSVVGLTHLRSFVAVAEVGSITRASRTLYLAQPAVTRQIAALERATRMQLLQRSHRGVELTEDGRRFLGGALMVVAAYDGLIGGHAVGLPLSQDRPAPPGQGELDTPAAKVVLRLGIEADAPQEATEAVRGFALGRPGGFWRIVRAHEPDLRRMLLDGQIDAAVVWLPPKDDLLGGVVVSQVPFFVAMSSALAGAYPSPAPWSVWSERPMALWSREDAPEEYDYWRDLVARRSGPITVLPVPMIDTAQDEMLLAVQKDMAVCVVTASHWYRDPRPGIEVRPLDPPLEAPLYLLWASARPSAWVADLVSAFSTPAQH